MEELTKKEEEVMHAVWKLKQAFVKDIIERCHSGQTEIHQEMHNLIGRDKELKPDIRYIIRRDKAT